MTLPRNHFYNLHFDRSTSEAMYFCGSRKLNIGISGIVSLTFWLAYLLHVRHLPFEDNVFPHLICLICGIVSLWLTLLFFFKHESLVLDKRNDTATYALRQFRNLYGWEKRLSQFNAVYMKLETVDSDEVWEFFLISDDGDQVYICPGSSFMYRKKHKDKAEKFAKEIADFIGCKLEISLQ
ncbi:hypothetical protein MCEMSEM23_01125 [Rhabdaerophilaceae bacterium]